MQDDLERVLFDEGTILTRLDEMAAQISEDYRDRELTVIAVLNGGTKTTGEVVFKQIALPEVAGRHILILDDILDSGLTLSAIRRKLEIARPKSIKVCVLLKKRIERLAPIEADYVGFEIGNEFVVGYGLDYMERYRNLPCVGVLRKELIAA